MKRIYALFWCIVLISCAYQSEAQTVYITRTGAKYHVGSCRYLRQSKISVELSVAKSQGYTPCSVCRPSTVTKATNQDADPVYPKKVESNILERPITITPSSQATQCTAMTKAGARCKRTTTSSSGKCSQHE